MSKKLTIFDDKTILSTPRPVRSSSLSSKDDIEKIGQLNDYPKRVSVLDDSPSILSIGNSKSSLQGSFTNAASYLHEQRSLARDSLKQRNNFPAPNITSISSRYFKRSEFSASNSEDKSLGSESTISESDLLPANSSTPRASIMSNPEEFMRGRHSVGHAITSFANSLSNTENNISKMMDQFLKTMDPTNSSFQSSEDPLAQLMADEMLWKRELDLPAQVKEFSVAQPSDLQQSIGPFFKERSDNLSTLLAKSPEKCQPRVPLIETSVSKDNVIIDEINESLSISSIAKVLSDTKQTPTKAFDYLMKPKKRVDSSSFKKSSLRDLNVKEVEEFSDNSRETIKENIDTLNIRQNLSPDFNKPKSILSSRSSSPLSYLPDGKLPIATTKSEIIWGCIKPGKNVSQEFVIRNKSSSRIGINCTISNPSFKLIKECSESNFSSSIKFILHPYESRGLTVIFAPTTLGAAVDNLTFTSMDPSHKQTVKQFIRLYGYGGNGNITIGKISKDTTGKFLLALGNIDDADVIKKIFIIRNDGSLPSFAYIRLTSNALYSFSNIELSPQTLVLLPGEEKEVTVTYYPKKEDFNYMQSKVNCSIVEIGKLTVLHGTEVNRGRLRKLCQKAKEKGLEIFPAIQDLIEKFPGEAMPRDLKHLRESSGAMEEVFRFLGSKEIIITLERDLENTLIERFQDESAMFHSLCENMSLDKFENTIRSDTCHIEPTRIILTPPNKVGDMIFLTSNSKKKLYFEVHCVPDGLHLKPRDGTIKPGETLIIELEYRKVCNEKTAFKIRILVDDEAHEVDVKVFMNMSRS